MRADKPRIQIDYPNGDRESFCPPRRLIGSVADALADGFDQCVIRVVMDKREYVLQSREHCNPLWRLQDGVIGEPTDHTRFSAIA